MLEKRQEKTTNPKSFQTQAMALVVTMRVKTSTMRNTAKCWVRYQWTTMKDSRKIEITLYISQDQKRLVKKWKKCQTSSPTNGSNFEQVLIEKMEQHNWTLLITCKTFKKIFRAWNRCIKYSSYGRANDEQKYTTLARKFHWKKCHIISQIMSLIRLNFQNNQGHPGTSVLKYLFFNEFAGLRPATLLKKRLRHRCFPVSLVKFLRTTLLQNASGRLLLCFIRGRKNILFTLSWKKQSWYGYTVLFLLETFIQNLILGFFDKIKKFKCKSRKRHI